MPFTSLLPPLRRAACVSLALFCAAATAAERGVTDTEIVLGQNLTLQGGKNAYGVAAAQGMKMYFDSVNAAGGVNGRKIVQVILDDDNKATNAEANARKLVQDGAFILFGAIDGGPSTAVMKVAGELKVPFFGPMAGPPTLRRPPQPMVFPVRAEHRDEFRALMTWGKNIGLATVGFLHADTDVGRQHLNNVSLAAKDLGLSVVVAIPFKGDPTDEQIAAMVKTIGEKKPDMFLNHGSAGLYQKLVSRAKAAGQKTTFMGVNSGSYQIAKGLGPLAQGMVFSQVVPSPWERKREIAREYQEAAKKASANPELSYGALEGYMTAKALVMALRTTGRDLTRASLVKVIESSKFDLGGVTARYSPGDHEGSQFVDLSMVGRDGRFIH
ncbi:MAG: ABC transporter substrate-binding protein [Burkholderiales bacterium]|nr:ABC transporter substrate-binding protein [Burkholderiales bacterium]